MKIPVISYSPCVFISRKAKEYEMNGKSGVSYKLNLEGPDEDTGEIKCSKDAYDQCQGITKYSPVEILCEFDVDNSRMVIVGVRVPVLKEEKNNIKSTGDKK